MKRVFWSLGLLAIVLVLFVQTGCWKNGENNPVSPHSGFSGEAPVMQVAPEVRFQFVVPGKNQETTISPAIQTAEGATPQVTFKLILINPGNTTNPTTTLSKIVSVDSGKATVVFSGIPAKTVVGEVYIEGGKYQGYSEFHGAADLIPNSPNIIEVSPKGSKFLADIIANVINKIVASPDLFAKVGPGLETRIKQAIIGLQTNSDGVYDEAVAMYQKYLDSFSGIVT